MLVMLVSLDELIFGIKNMHDSHLRQLDMNLLLVFHTLIKLRSVTLTAKEIGLTQAGVSHALARLRNILGDELFLKYNRSMQPTARALQLAEPIQFAIEQLRHALQPTEFDPSRSTETFRLLATDYFATLVLPHLVGQLQKKAPLVTLKVVSSSAGNVGAMLEEHEVAFAAGIFKKGLHNYHQAECEHMTLFEDPYVCVMRPDHPLAGKKMTKSRYLASKHILFSPTGSVEMGVERYLRPHGIQRNVSVVLSHFLAAPAIMLNSDMIMTISSKIAHFYAEHFGLRTAPLPIPIPPPKVQLVWNARFGSYPPHAWFRSVILECCAGLNVK